MKIAIIGATGRTGRLAAAEAVRRHHEVIAVSRSGNAITGTRAVAVDLQASIDQTLADALVGCHAIVSTLGQRSRADGAVLEHGIKMILTAMQATGVRRIVAVSAAPVGTIATPTRPNPPRHDPGDTLLQRWVLTPLIKLVFARIYRDTARMEDHLRSSDTDWTLVRPPRLLDQPATGQVRTATDRNVAGGRTITRADLAEFLLDTIDTNASIRHSIGVAN